MVIQLLSKEAIYNYWRGYFKNIEANHLMTPFKKKYNNFTYFAEFFGDPRNSLWVIVLKLR